MLIKFYIPTQDKTGAVLDVHQVAVYTKQVLSACIDTNGGATSYTAKGYFKNNKGQIVMEDVAIIETFGDMPTIDLLKWRDFLNQDCIGYAIGDAFYTV